MYDEKKIDELVGLACKYGLMGVDFLEKFDYATLCREYNGVGPEWIGQAVRGRLTKYLALFEPAALIHDMRNYESDGSRERFCRANCEFLINCHLLAIRKYAWYSWRRWRACAVADALYDFVDGPGGWSAWHDCSERRRQ